ncbi:PREDICTED: single-stranded DNA-binding protein, mitochondrial-like isoform X2 [Tarenaya hassleriana]|uniref:single-stranded DNA-binding protein, mitochondrial-like isoform X2 n=1 Tax=Tarenaya hassleriana TaxID=28532 RepID=UPI00053C6185|nr:PREDICTED: single-stranded DNA-binding protein, mitochondrial-like isoform X2 [Tarenaya hassleriana]
MAMNFLAVRISKLLRSSPTTSPLVASAGRSARSWFSSGSIDEEILDEGFDQSPPGKPELRPQGVDPRKGWDFRGVHRAIICGKVGQAPLQKILRNGRTVTIFTIGTGGMFDQRLVGTNNQPRPAQWHRIAVHNEVLGTYAVQKLIKNSSVYIEGDIETRVYNDSITSEVKSIPEICVRNDGKIRLIKSGESISKISFDELKEGLF